MCYFQDEAVTDSEIGIGGENRHRYSLSNCYWQATVNHATQVCHCKIWNFGEPTEDLSFCTGKNLTCFKDVLQDFGRITSFTDNDNRTYECYEGCNTYTHSITTNSGSYPNSETFLYDAMDLCAIMDKMATSCKDPQKQQWLDRTTFNCSVLDNSTEYVNNCTRLYYSHGEDVLKNSAMIDTERFRNNTELKQAIFNYTNGNVALVNVYFNDVNVKSLVRKQAYKWPKFLASWGGHLGLALGMSFITLLEALYLLIRILMLICTHWISRVGASSSAQCSSHSDDDYHSHSQKSTTDWRHLDPDVTKKRRTICIDCPCSCLRVKDETAKMFV